VQTIRLMRLLKRLSLRELAARAQLSEATLWRIEAGRRAASADELARLAHALAITPAELVEQAAPDLKADDPDDDKASAP